MDTGTDPHGPAGHRTARSSTSVYRRFRIRAQRYGVPYTVTDRRTGGRHIASYIHSTAIGMNRVNGGQLAGNEGEGWGREPREATCEERWWQYMRAPIDADVVYHRIIYFPSTGRPRQPKRTCIENPIIGGPETCHKALSARLSNVKFM